MEELFSKIIVVGVGLLGGSVALAAKRSRLAFEIVGVCRSPVTQSEALEQGVIDRAFISIEEVADVVREKDSPLPLLVVVCSPVAVVAQQVTLLMEALKPSVTDTPFSLLITDVGSTKSAIVRQIEQLPLPPGVLFIGSHPIAGSEKSGVHFAKENLFDQRMTIITPTVVAEPLVGTPSKRSATCPIDLSLFMEDAGEMPAFPRQSVTYQTYLSLLEEFWHRLGSRVVRMTPEEHDAVLAKTSHLPHLLSAVLAKTVDPKDFPFSGTGFFDMTRLAAGNPEIWIDIFQSNRDFLLEAVTLLESELQCWKSVLSGNQRDEIITLLYEAKKRRDALGS